MAQTRYAPILLGTLLCYSGIPVFTAQSIRNTSERTDKAVQPHFNQPIRHFLPNVAGTHFFVTADTENGAKEWSAGLLQRDNWQWTPLTPTQTGSALQPELNKNPYYDSSIVYAALMEGPNRVMGSADGRLLFVTKKYPNALVMINNYFKKTPPKAIREKSDQKKEPVPVVEQTHLIMHDADGRNCREIVALGASHAHVLAAVTPQNKLFGDNGSGLALAILGTIVIPSENKNTEQKEPDQDSQKVIFVTVDTPTGSNKYTGIKKIKKETEVPEIPTRACPFNRASSVVCLGDTPLASLTVHDIYWSNEMHAFYISVTAHADAHHSTGVRGVVMARINKDNTLQLVPLVPDAAVTQDGIVTNQGAGASITISRARTMATSTALNYLIIQKENTVYALPLVRATDVDTNLTHGTVANCDAVPAWIEQKANPNVRHFTHAAGQAHQVVTPESFAARVGVAPIKNGTITNMFVKGDAVFTVVDAQDPSHAGIFYSQAIFNATGMIVGWSAWRRAITSFTDTGAPEKILDAQLNNAVGDFVLVCANNEGQKTEIKHTMWSNNEKDPQNVMSIVSDIFPKDHAGVHGIIDIPAGVPGLPDSSLQILTGLGTIMMVQTSIASHDGFVPCNLAHCERAVKNTQGTFDGISGSVQIVTGGTLNELGPITTAQVVSSGDYGFVCVGGARGFAVLTTSHATGWSAYKGIGPEFSSVPSMTFKKYGNYTFVRKLIVDDGMLYILTDTYVDRITLTGNWEHDIAHAVRVCTITDVCGSDPGAFFDIVVSGKLALLGTSNGLWRIANGNDVRLASACWQPVPLPEGFLCVRQLHAITVSGCVTDLTHTAGGMIYALSGYKGKSQARLHRLAISHVTDTITDTTVQLLPDLYVRGTASSLISFGGYRSFFLTDGAISMHTGFKEDGSVAAFSTPADTISIRSYIKSAPVRGTEFALPLGGKILVGLLQSHALGNRIMAGDFGLVMQK
jgi:hypothetical protein